MNSNRVAVRSALDWLMRAQDVAGDGGVAAWFSLLHGWQPSYIETTGYIINTFFDCAAYFKDAELKKRAFQMADFLIEMQDLGTGAYRTAVPARAVASPPTVFNTGQDLLGMCEAYRVSKNTKYLRSAMSAADFLVRIQEKDGSWIQYTYGSKTHVYHTRVAWGLLEVAHCSKTNYPKKSATYREAAIKNLQWAQEFQQPNGWFSNNELPPPNITIPYTHTISYAIEGFLWSGLLLKNKKFISVASAGALPLAKHYLKHDFLPGSFDGNWQSSDGYTCLTGDAQLALVWFQLFKTTGNKTFLRAAKKMVMYLKSIQNIKTANKNIRGALAGSWPIWGDLLRNRGYCRLAYPNWATKFFIDALLTQERLGIT